jgi:hypothetical protein
MLFVVDAMRRVAAGATVTNMARIAVDPSCVAA